MPLGFQFGPTAPKPVYFEKHDEANHYGPYDFDSVMHYAACAFSVCASCSSTDPDCRTITVRSPYATQWQSRIGQRGHLSDLDQLVMSFLYPYAGWRFLDQDYAGFFESGTFAEPYKTLGRALDETPSGGTLWALYPDTYTVARNTRLTKPMTIRAALGTVTLRAN